MPKPFVSLNDVEFTDNSNKVVVCASEQGTPRLWKMFPAETSVEYYDRESTKPPKRGA